MSHLHHENVGPLSYGLSAGSGILFWVGSQIQEGYLLAAGYDFSAICSDLAHLGGFLMAVAAVGTLTLNIHDRIRGRRK